MIGGHVGLKLSCAMLIDGAIQARTPVGTMSETNLNSPTRPQPEQPVNAYPAGPQDPANPEP
jgi:hypothetical protein